MSRPPPESPLWNVGVRDALLRHFDAHARPLPWRRTTDPYAVFISEVMLQQTRVAAVVNYYERWVRRFPDIATLAAAPLDDVLKAWEGLGYYSRARNLHRAALIMRERHCATVPDEYAALRALPGVGEYTAGAVSSIAFGMRRPAIDGNVRRVVARLLDDPEPSAARLRAIADALLPDDRPGDLNQALMELGATICAPRAPKCDTCPLREFCVARAAGTQRDRPRRRRTPTPPLFSLATAVIRAPDGRVLLTRRPSTGLLARMWCLPAREIGSASNAAATVLDITRSFVGARTLPEPVALGSIDHTFSHRRERYLCWLVNLADTRPVTSANTAWAGHDAAPYALPAAQRRILDLFRSTIG